MRRPPHSLRPALERLEPRHLLSADYFVSIDGLDTNPGTIAAPFRTIQRAADVMAPGDTAYLRGGTYRETVNVTKNDLTFEAYNHEYVVVTGADVVTGWTQHSGDIYKANFGAIEPQFTQVFFDGARQQIARYPDNTSDDMLSIGDEDGYADVTVLPTDQGTGLAGATFDTAPPGGVDHWAGGYFRAISGYTTGANPTGLITASDGASLTVDPIFFLWEEGNERPLGDGKGYIVHLNALSTPGEWWFEDNTLYYWKPGGSAPQDGEVEAQRRESAFVIDGYDGLTLRSLHIKAANIELNDADNNRIEDSTFSHLKGWFHRRGYGSSTTQLGGVYVSGDNNVFDGCVFEATWGNLLNFEWGATDNLVTNSFFNNNGWMGMFTSSIANYGHNTTVTHSTFGSTGRFHIRTWDKFNLLHNDFYDAMNMGQDAGSIQAVDIDLKGSEIAYNTIHDMDTLRAYERNKQFVVAFYLEGASNYTAHHNLVYNIQTSPLPDGAFVYLGPRRIEIENVLYYNNTVWDVDWRFRVWNRDMLGSVNNVQFKNNVFDSRMDNSQLGDPYLISEFVLENNVESDDAGLLFVDAAKGDFRLAPGSPAINAGQVIPGITDGYTGAAPDAGAFESGVAPWEYGVNRLTPTYYDVGDDAFQTWLSGQLTPTQMLDPGTGGYLVDPGVNGLTNVVDFALDLDVLSTELPTFVDSKNGENRLLVYERRRGDLLGVELTVEYADNGSGVWNELTDVDPFVTPNGLVRETVIYLLPDTPGREYRLAARHRNGAGTEIVETTLPFYQIPELTGDFNRDGAVNAADYSVWRDAEGTDTEPYAGADGNGDGVVDTADYDLWKANYGATLPPPAAAAAAIVTASVSDEPAEVETSVTASAGAPSEAPADEPTPPATLDEAIVGGDDTQLLLLVGELESPPSDESSDEDEHASLIDKALSSDPDETEPFGFF